MDNQEKNKKYEKPRISTIQDLSSAIGTDCGTGKSAGGAGACVPGLVAGLVLYGAACAHGFTATTAGGAACATGDAADSALYILAACTVGNTPRNI